LSLARERIMRAWKFAFAVLCAIISVGGIRAQDAPPTAPTPIATVDAGDFRALTISANGRWMMVADAATSRLRIYDLDTETPTLVVSPELDGIPLDAAAIGQAVLIAVDTGGRAGLAQIVAPIDYDRDQPFAPVNWIDLSDRPRSVSASPDGAWAVIVGSSGYTLFETLSPEDVNSTFYPTPVSDAALLNDTVFLADRNSPRIMTATIESGGQASINRSVTIDLPALAERLALNLSGTLGAAALEDGSIALFDPESGEVISMIETGAAADLHFLSFEGGEWLIVLSDDRQNVTLIDVSDPANAGEIGALDLPAETSTIQAITTYGSFIYVADRSTVRIFQASQP